MGRTLEIELFETQEKFFRGLRPCEDCDATGKIYKNKCKKCDGTGEYKVKFPAFIGGYGSGKTKVFVDKAIVSALQNPGHVGMLVEPTYRLVKDTLRPELEKWLRKYGISYSYKKTDMEYHLYQSGTVIRLRSGDNPEGLKGPNIAWCGIDEIGSCTEELWGVCVSRVRIETEYGGVFVAGTPESVKKGKDWVYEKWGTDSGRDKGYYAWHADTRENTTLPKSYYGNLVDSHSPEELVMYASGQFIRVPFKGRVYKEFVEDFHSEIVTYEKGKGKLILFCDFNVDPCVWGLAQYHKSYGVRIIKEFVLRDTTTPEMLLEVLEYLRDIGVKPSSVICIGDKSGKNRNTVSDHNNYTLIKKEGFNVLPSVLKGKNPDVEASIGLTNACLRDSKVVVDYRCKMLITDLNRVIYKPGENKISKSDPELTHASDGFRYLIWEIWGKKRVKSRSRSSKNFG